MTELDISEVCRKYGGSILRRCRALLRDPSLAEDAAQEVFVVLLRKGSQYRGDAALGSWVYRVTTNTCLNRMRGESRRTAREESTSDAAWASTTTSDPYERYAAKSEILTLAHALDPLGKEILIYRYLDGMTQEEIAATTGKSRRTVGKRLKQIDAIVEEHKSHERL